MAKVSYLAALYRPRTSSIAVYEFPEGEAFNWELENHCLMANDKVMELGGGFLPLGYGTINYYTQDAKDQAFESFFQATVDKLNSVRPIPPCDVPPFEDWSDNNYDM
jgi:hypothetical protein